MSEVLSVLVTLIVVFGIQMLKPEWFLGWLLKLINQKNTHPSEQNRKFVRCKNDRNWNICIRK